MMMSIENFSFYVLICVLAPLIGAFTLSFIIIFERHFDSLQRETSKLALEKELQQVNYDQLNSKIQSHFFFNTLNTMLSLARLDRKGDLVAGLEAMAKFFKFKYATNEPLILFDAELSNVNHYLDIQKLRFGDRLSIIIEIEPTCKNALMPPFMLQTLVENTFKHGFEKNPGPSILKIIAFETDHILNLEVWNTHLLDKYSDEEQYTSEEGGYGLKNIQNRLRLLFPEQDTSLTLTHVKNETIVLAKYPFVKEYAI